MLISTTSARSPVGELRLFSDQAPVITTRPTAALADTLLRDSLKLHRRATQKPGREQQYSETDLRQVIDRFRPCGYQAADLSDHVAHIEDSETLHFEFEMRPTYWVVPG